MSVASYTHARGVTRQRIHTNAAVLVASHTHARGVTQNERTAVFNVQVASYTCTISY